MEEWVKLGRAPREKAEWVATRLSEKGVPYWLDVLHGDPVSIMVHADAVIEARQALKA
jgi:hypothetical protein